MFSWIVKMALKSTTKTPEQCHSHCFGVFIIDLTYVTHGFHACFTYFTYISQFDASLLTLKK